MKRIMNQIVTLTVLVWISSIGLCASDPNYNHNPIPCLPFRFHKQSPFHLFDIPSGYLWDSGRYSLSSTQ